MSKDDAIVIVGAARTAIGALQGELASATSPELGACAIAAAVERANVAKEDIEEVIMGCVLQAGQGQAPARQAAIGAGLPNATGATTINKMCGSGMQAVLFAEALLNSGTRDIMIAGGQESMSNAPYLLSKARAGYRLGHGELKDHMFLDGLEDAYDRGQLMGVFAEQAAEHFNFSREAQDEFAITSLERAKRATDEGLFQEEIEPITVKIKRDDVTVSIDETPMNARPDKIPKLKPAFKKDGTVTAANASSISDGAAALVLMRESTAKTKGLKPLAKIVATSTHAQEPAWFTTAPVTAIKSVLQKANWSTDDVDLYEINEAFAVVTMAAMHELNLPHEKVNVHGGACALGHPIGASGARILVTLLYALEQLGKQKGVASLCIGGGEATAVAIERV